MIGITSQLVAATAWTWAACAHAATPLTPGIQQFERAYAAWNQAGFWKAAESFRQAAASHPPSASAHYWLGTAHFHRMLALRGATGPRIQPIADHELASAIAALDTALELDPAHAEAHAILATLHGMRIDDTLASKLRHGPAVYKHQRQALQHGANNPRVQYLLGAGLLHTAGDDADRLDAVKALLLAAALFEAEQKQTPAADHPRWGHDACLTFIGDAFANLQQPSKARHYYQQALPLRPGNRPAMAGLETLPPP